MPADGILEKPVLRVQEGLQTGGLPALLNKPPVPGTMPNRVSNDTKKKILELSIEHPALGQQRISDELMMQNQQIWSRASRI